MTLEELLGKCDVCGGTGVAQINEPLKIDICQRCHGIGKNRIVQLIMNDRFTLYALTSNGIVLRRLDKENEWNPY